MDLPEPIATAVQPLFDVHPLETAMKHLVVTAAAGAELTQLVDGLTKNPVFASRPELCAGLWLYVDELDRSHVISQGIHDTTGSYWHGIMHRREGDFGNSHYWFNKVGHHPAMDLIPHYDAHAFIDEVQDRHRLRPKDLVRLQPQEWQALFTWCATQRRVR